MQQLDVHTEYFIRMMLPCIKQEAMPFLKEECCILNNAYSIEKVKILVQAKADINKMDNNPNNSAVFSAIIHNQMDVLLYLLQNGADYTVKFKQGDYTTEKTIYKECDILDMLRLLHYPLDSEKHRQKKEVIRFLSKVGLDYSKTSIPNWVINWAKKEYPNSWKEYLSHY